MRNETEKKLLESEVALQREREEIKKSETKLRQAIDTIPALAWCNLPDGTNEFLNKGWHEYTGLSPEQSHGWGWQVAFHPQDLPPLMNRWREMLASGEPGETEARLRRYDGAYRWFLIRAQPLRDEVGNIVRWYGTSTDIDDRKRAEQKLRESEENLRTITDAIRQSIAVLAPDGTILYLNQVFREQTGLTMREAHDKTLHTRVFHPDDLGRALAERQKGLLRGTPFEYEARNLMKDGQYRWWLIQCNPLKDERGQIIRWYSTGTDIDDRKRVEEALRASEFNARMIVDGIPGLVARISPAGEVEVVNRPLLDYFGKDLEGIRNWANSDNIYPDDLPLAIETFNNSLPTGQPFDVEHRLRRFDGVYRWFQSRGLPLRDPEGRILHWYVLLTDIEERKQAEDKLRRSKAFLADGQRLSKTGTFSWSIEKNEIIWSEELYSIFSFDPATPVTLELIGSRVHPEDLPMLEDMVARAGREEGQFAYEHRIVMPEGSIKYIHLAGHTVHRGDGRLEYIGAAQDVTERRVAEEQLRERELNLRRITQTIPGMLWSATPEGEVDYCNRPWLEFVAMTAEQARGWGWAIAIYPDDRDGLIESWHASLTSGTPLDVEARMRRFDGAYRWFLFRANALRDESGTIIKWYGTNTDIEDRKRREEALRASELSWRQIIDNVPGFVYALSATGEVEFINHRTLEYFGKTREELKDWSRLGIVHPDDLPRAIDALTRAIETGQSYEIEHRCRRADGVYRWFQVRGCPARNSEDKVIAWYFLITDIDDRKRAEADLQESYLRLTEAQRLSKTGSFITDLVGDDHNWSEEAFRIFEFDPSTKVTVQMVQNMVHPEDLPSFGSMISRAMTGEDVDFSFRILTPRGAMKHIRGIARVIEHVAGRPLFIGALQDVTESKIAEEALNRARSELAHVARVTTLNALTASIAHEINQPLSGIITNANTCLLALSEEPPDFEGARQTARRMIRDGNRASDVINRLRTLYSKKDSRPEPTDLNEATQEVISLSLSDLQRNRVILRHELADDLPLVTGDRIQLQQVILNLLRNASDAMRTVADRPRELLVKTEREEGNRVRLSVKDVGVGFEPEAADKLFEVFYSTKDDGMGVGLHVSRSIIEAHHGRLWATVNNGPGATFSFAIPSAPEA